MHGISKLNATWILATSIYNSTPYYQDVTVDHGYNACEIFTFYTMAPSIGCAIIRFQCMVFNSICVPPQFHHHSKDVMYECERKE